MTEHQLSLLPFYAGWGIYNQRLVAAIAPLTAEQLALRNTPQHWSIGMYATHIVANRAWWFHARMGEGSADLTSLELWALGVCEGDVDPLHPAAELVAGLEKTWQMIEQTLARLTPADLFEVFPPLDQAERVRHAKLVEPALQPIGIHGGAQVAPSQGVHSKVEAGRFSGRGCQDRERATAWDHPAASTTTTAPPALFSKAATLFIAYQGVHQTGGIA